MHIQNTFTSVYIKVCIVYVYGVCVYANVGYDLKLSHIAVGIAVGEVTKYNIKWMFEPEEGAHKQNPNLNPNQTHID